MPELIALCRIMLAMLESAHYAPEDLLCSKLCRHNLSRPIDGDVGNSEAYAKIFEENRYVLSVFLGMLVQVEFSY